MWNEFECLACFETPTQLREMCTGQFSFEVGVLDDGEVIWQAIPIIHENYTKQYYCGHCGYTLKHKETQEPITDKEELIDWLKRYDAGEVPEI